MPTREHHAAGHLPRVDEVLAVLPGTARDLLEAILKTRTREYKSDFARRYYGEGKAEGLAEGRVDSVLEVLSARGIDVPEAARARINECTDLEQLGVWVRRAATVGSVEELFE
jgi:hypothetical protein